MNKAVVVVGTGYVGLPAALMWAKAGLRVVGVDIDSNVVSAINEGTMLMNETELQELLHHPSVRDNLVAQGEPSAGDVFVVAVPTPVDPLKKVADLSSVEAALRAICPHLRAGNLVIIESTVPPLTCQNVVKPLIEQLTGLRVPSEIMLCHCPERILPGNIFHEIVHNDRLIGGLDDASTEAAKEIYQVFVKGNLVETSDVVAEVSKLMENTFRDVNIALANEFDHICERLNVDVREAIKLANRHPRVDILSPGIGVGGHCIPVDPWFLKEIAPYDSRLISMARLINDEMPNRIAGKIRQAVRDVPEPRIVALGATYKRNCEDMRESPAIQIVRRLTEDGYQVQHFDPLIAGANRQPLTELCRGADLVAILVSHDVLIEELDRLKPDIESVMRNPKIINFDRLD